MGGIIWRYAYLDPISLYHFNSSSFHAAGENTSNFHIIVAINFHGPTTQDLGHDTFHMYQIVSTHEYSLELTEEWPYPTAYG